MTYISISLPLAVVVLPCERLRRAKHPHQKDREKLVHVDPFSGDQFLHDVAVQTGKETRIDNSL